MTYYNTERCAIINLDNIEKVAIRPVEDGCELTFNFISGKSYSMHFDDKESCRKEYRDVLLIMSKEDE